jgi:hypothetical protein
MIVTCMWGVSDSLRAARGAKKGAANWGSPRLLPYAVATPAEVEHGRHRAPPVSWLRSARLASTSGEGAAHAQLDKAAATGRTERVKRGNGAPESPFPQPVPPLSGRRYTTRG